MIPASSNETPVDLAAVEADDALLDMLGGNAAGRSEADAELARVLVAWRRDADAEPVGRLVGVRLALAIILVSRRGAVRRQRIRVAVVAVCALMLAVDATLLLLWYR